MAKNGCYPYIGLLLAACQSNDKTAVAYELMDAARVDGLQVTADSTLVKDAVTDANEENGWQLFSGSSNVYLQQSAMAQDGSLYLTGCFRDDIWFGDTHLTGNSAVTPFLAKIGKDRKVAWAKEFLPAETGGDDWNCSDALAIAKNGDVVIAGQFNGSLDLVGQTITGGFYDLFLARFDPQGVRVWGRAFVGTTGEENAAALAIDSQDNIYFLGGSRGDVDLGGGPRRADYGGFLAKYDGQGSYLWDKVLGEGFVVLDGPMVLDSSEQPVIALSFDAPFDLEGDIVQPTGQDAAVIALSKGGALRWFQVVSAPSTESVRALSATASGKIIIAGSFLSAQLTLGSSTLTNNNDEYSDVFVASLGGEHGIVEWASKLNGEQARDIREVNGAYVVSGFSLKMENDVHTIELATLEDSGSVLSNESIFTPFSAELVNLFQQVGGVRVITAVVQIPDGSFYRKEIGVKYGDPL